MSNSKSRSMRAVISSVCMRMANALLVILVVFRAMHTAPVLSICPKAHQAYRAMSDWSPERFERWASDIGPQTRQVVSHILKQKRHKEQTYRQVLALLSSAKKYGRDRLNNACARALDINSPTRRSVKSILEKGLDRIKHAPATTQTQKDLFVDDHENIRGENYYH